MKSIIPSFTLSERSLITTNNPRGWNTEIATNPVAYFDKWQSAIKDAGAVFLLRPFGMSKDGYATHTRTCYGGEAGKTFPCGPEWGLSEGMDEVIGQWCDDGVIVYLYCGGLIRPAGRLAGALTELEKAAGCLRSSSGVPDHPNVRWIIDNIGEKAHDETTPTDYMVDALRAVGRYVLFEPRPREEWTNYDPEEYCCLWNRQRAALADTSDNPIGLSGLVMVGGNKPDPKELLDQLDTPEKRVAEAKWQLDQYPITVALATAGLTPERWAKEVTQ